MKHPPLLSRMTLGQPNYLLLALAAAFLLALSAGGAWQAVRTSNNQLSEWLPSEDLRVEDLRWFESHFDGERTVRISWDGCTMANREQVQWLAKKLADQTAANDRLFERVTTGPALVAKLTSPPFNLPAETALRRLEGAYVGPARRTGGGQPARAEQRATCLVVVLTPAVAGENQLREAALDRIRQVAAEEIGIGPGSLALVGPAVDVDAIDAESQWSLTVLGSLAVAVSFVAARWRLGGWAAAAVVAGAGVMSAAVSLAIVYYTGVVEVAAFNLPAPNLGRPDALLLAMPVLAFAVGAAAAIRLIAYYRDARADDSTAPAETAVREGWPAWLLSVLLLAAALGAFCLSDLAPLRKFGLFAGASAIAGVIVVLLAVPVFLYRFGGGGTVSGISQPRRRDSLTRLFTSLSERALSHPGATIVCLLAAAGVAAAGIPRMNFVPPMPPLVGERSELRQDYNWFGERLGSGVPAEVVLTVPHERLRQADEHAESDGQQFRMTVQERLALIQEIHRRLSQAPQMGGVFSAAVFTPEDLSDGAEQEVLSVIRAHSCLADENHGEANSRAGRELWRLQILAPTTGDAALGPQEILSQVHAAVEPVLTAYEQRDALVGQLHERSQELSAAKVSVLYRGAPDSTQPDADSPETTLAGLLNRSGVAEVKFVNATALEGADLADRRREEGLAALNDRDAVLKASAAVGDAVGEQLLSHGINYVDLSQLPVVEESAAIPLAEIGGPRPIRAVYTGLPTMSVATAADVAQTLWRSLLIVGPPLALAMMLLAWNPVAGLLCMAPVAIALAAPLGVMGWTGVAIDVGVILTASVALAAMLDGVVHYLAWFRRGAAAGLSRTEASRLAVARLLPTLVDAAVIVGMGMLVFAASGIASLRLLGVAGIGLLAMSAVGVLVLLPAIVASRVGWFFAPAPIRTIEASSEPPALKVAAPPTDHGKNPAVRTDGTTAGGPPVPHHPRPVRASEERAETAEGPHSSLQARLQRLRRAAGD